MELQNTDVETRVWPTLQTTDGTTLELGPGEIGDVAVDELPEDEPFLKPVSGGKSGGKRSSQGNGSEGASGPDNVSGAGSDSASDDTKKPAEAKASGKEA